jgi:hypothetical protein
MVRTWIEKSGLSSRSKAHRSIDQQQTCALMPSSIGWPRFAVFECSVTLGKHDLIGERLRDAKADADVAMICRYGAPMRGPQQVRVIHK